MGGWDIPCFITWPMPIDLKHLVEEAEMDSLVRCLAILTGYTLPETWAACADGLDRYALAATREDADSYLGFFQAVDANHKLYEHYFPEEYARSTKSIVPALDEAYSERECEFFSLVEAHFFPLPWFFPDNEARDERSYILPLEPLGREWWNDNLEDWEPGWLLLLCLLGEDDGEDELTKRLPDVAQALLPLSAKQGILAFSALERDCRRAKTPLAYLPEALNILFHDTGSWFLDIYTETPDAYIEWTQEDIDKAIVHMRRATRTSRRASRFITWIDEDPIPRFKEVLTLWNQYCQEKQDHQLRLLDLTFPTEK